MTPPSQRPDSRWRSHIEVSGRVTDREFRRTGGGGGRKVATVDRESHGSKLLQQTTAAFDTAERAFALDASLAPTGTILYLEGNADHYPMKLDSLDSQTRHKKPQPKWVLLTTHRATDDAPETACVWVSDEFRSAFEALFEDYLRKESATGKPRREELIANMSRVRHAELVDLWTSAEEPPREGVHWWQLWLDPSHGSLQSAQEYAANLGLKYLPRRYRLNDRAIVWVQASWADLQPLPFSAVPVSEIRLASFADTVEDLDAAEQEELLTDLVSRVTPPGSEAPRVCLLDTGCYRNHLLLKGSLASVDQHSIFGPTSTVGDVSQHGHGTAMAGLALYDDVEPHLLSSQEVILAHALESVRMIADNHENTFLPRDYGTAMVEAVTLPEIAAQRQRVFAMTLSAEPDLPGAPTLWSSTVDALAVGSDVAQSEGEVSLLGPPAPAASRLFVVAAGNIDPHAYNAKHLDTSDVSAITDPAQAWNALTVGAFTAKDQLPTDPQFRGWQTVARKGELSPHSRTSVPFGRQKFPIKPDICMEGGNVLTNGEDFHELHPLVSLRVPGTRSNVALTSANATSAATAQAARLAARVMAMYPDYWPETVRGVLTHHAEWTPAMQEQIHRRCLTKSDRLTVLRRYGWGVPDEQRVLKSSGSAVTMLVQDEFQPFKGKNHAMSVLRLHELPWPEEILRGQLATADVRLRVTLSYFIEPSASRRGWRNRYAYASHHLRFDLQEGTEDVPAFVARINRQAAQEESVQRVSHAASGRWLIGSQSRELGSLHQDEWHGSGAELARTRTIAVFPAGGWWKNNSRLDRRDQPVRYSLLLSLTAPKLGVDLYTPIVTELAVPIAT